MDIARRHLMPLSAELVIPFSTDASLASRGAACWFKRSAITLHQAASSVTSKIPLVLSIAFVQGAGR